jgi:hypothetical protein
LGREGSRWGHCPQAPEVYRFGALVEKEFSGEGKRLQENLKPLAEPLNRGATVAAQVALPQSPILRRCEGIGAKGCGEGQNKTRWNEQIRFCSNNSSGFDLTILSGFVPPPTQENPYMENPYIKFSAKPQVPDA